MPMYIHSQPVGRLSLAVVTGLIPILLSACATYGRIDNKPATGLELKNTYSITRMVKSKGSNKINLLLAFSGGGTRAAALAYSVLTELRDTIVTVEGRHIRLLDEVDLISSVSGGSFTAAYFGLNGDGIFTDFEKIFLRRDISARLLDGLLEPGLWFSSHGRTEMAIDLYENTIFKGATFSELENREGPLIIINATDLGRGVRFSFLQGYFDLLCSDLSSFPVSRAVAASSAVPVIFNPVVLKNHGGCRSSAREYIEAARRQAVDSPRLAHILEGLNSYSMKNERQYIHLVDGGITDNLGLLAIYEITEIAGGAKKLMAHLGAKPASRLMVISVNASTSPQYEMEASNKAPSMEDTINSVTDIPIHRTNASTLDLIQKAIRRWSMEVQTAGGPIKTYFVRIDFNSLSDPEEKRFFNQIPTNYSLTREQVDGLLNAGRRLLKTNSEFQRFLEETESLP